MLVMKKRLACCTRTPKISTDFDRDHQARIMTYDGLESCIHDNQSSEDESRTSRGDGCITDSFNDDDFSCSSSKDTFRSFSSQCLKMKRDDEQGSEEWELSQSPQHFYVKEKPAYAMHGEEMLKYLNLKTEHKALETVNKLEAAMFSWKERMRITQEDSGKSPLRTSWPFMKDSMPSTEKVGLWLDRAQTLLKLLKSRYPNLPQTFLDAAKVQYGKVSF
ncbi:hypothetical protein AHAS_Ahas20G0003000 [Arachis hypogaea]